MHFREMLRAKYLYGPKLMHRMYHAWRVIFQDDPVREPVVFHVIEDGKLVLLGAMSALALEDGLYLDCAPDWEDPVLNDDVLTITQAYSATLNGDILEVE